MTTGPDRWTWEVPTADGATARSVGEDAGSRYDAEAWLGEHWRELAADGATHARLLRGGELVAVTELRAFTWPR